MQVQITRRHYKRAPITEAVISLGFELPGGVRLEDLLKVHASLQSDYLKRGEMFTVQLQVEPSAEVPGRVSPREVIGYQLASEDGQRLVALRLGELAFSQLAPYDSWETLRSEAKRVWDACESTLHPLRITRVGVRYINRIDIPSPEGRGVDLDIYFRTAPRIAPELPQLMKTFFVRLELELRESHGVLIITESEAQSPSPDVVSTLLDLAVIVQNADFDSASAWRTIEELRDEKNAAFENCITDAARQLFE
jgi:uncharacterized protein (TIGR04255 family)